MCIRDSSWGAAFKETRAGVRRVDVWKAVAPIARARMVLMVLQDARVLDLWQRSQRNGDAAVCMQYVGCRTALVLAKVAI